MPLYCKWNPLEENAGTVVGPAIRISKSTAMIENKTVSALASDLRL